MNNEKIYIIVPVYKVEDYLERCVDSILNQTYQNFELILVDDGSPDNCGAICDRYAQQYENITVIHQENGGVSAARNTGIKYVQKKAASHEWMAFVDSDDYIHPKYLQYLLEGALSMGTTISSCRYLRIPDAQDELVGDGQPDYALITPEEYWARNRTNAMIIWGKLYRVQCFEHILYPVGAIHEDEFVTYKVLFQTDSIALVDAPLYNYCCNETSIMHSEWSPKRLVALDAFEEQITFFKQNDYPVACRYSTRDLLQYSMKNLMFIRHLSPKYDYLIKEVKDRRNKAFRLYASEVGLKKAVAYWYEVRIKSPMKRVLSKETVLSFLKRKIKNKLNIR